MPVTNGAGIGEFFRALVTGKDRKALAERRGRLAAYEEMLAEASTYDKREQAKRGAAENAGLDNLESALTPLLGADMARAASQAARAKYNLHEATQAGNDVQIQGFRTGARDALATGDYTTGNANLAAIDGKPLQISDESNGIVFNPYGDSGQATHLTAVGSSMVNENNAAAANSYASANEHKVRAEDVKTRGADGGKGGLNLDAGMVTSAFQAPILDDRGQPVTNPLTGKPEMGTDQAKLGEFFNYLATARQRNPKLTADQAVVDYMATGQHVARENLQDYHDAQAAVATGKITLEEAKRRLRAAGMPGLAERLR